MTSDDLKKSILKAQRNEITEYYVYKKLSKATKIREHAEILSNISNDEMSHYERFKKISLEDVKPDKFKVFFYFFISRIFGLNFGLKLMESGEDSAQDVYGELEKSFPEIRAMIDDENKHENSLVSLINEEKLKYISSIVLGLNDALVELTAALVGFTLALQNTKLIGIVGLITGIAAAMSMASSEYLSTKHEKNDKNPLKASIYTGLAYIATVIFLVFPYFIFSNLFLDLALVLINAILVIFIFTYYISVAKDMNFKNKFFEMLTLSLSVAGITFFIGLAIRKTFGVGE